MQDARDPDEVLLGMLPPRREALPWREEGYLAASRLRQRIAHTEDCLRRSTEALARSEAVLLRARRTFRTPFSADCTTFPQQPDP